MRMINLYKASFKTKISVTGMKKSAITQEVPQSIYLAGESFEDAAKIAAGIGDLTSLSYISEVFTGGPDAN